jgi:hypothetical protein
MAVTDEWDEVDQAFDGLEAHSALHSTLAAMRKLVNMVKHDAAFADVHPRVSLASIMFSRASTTRGVYVGWKEDVGYDIAFVDSMMELSEVTIAQEDAVVQVLREYLDRLGN